MIGELTFRQEGVGDLDMLVLGFDLTRWGINSNTDTSGSEGKGKEKR